MKPVCAADRPSTCCVGDRGKFDARRRRRWPPPSRPLRHGRSPGSGPIHRCCPRRRTQVIEPPAEAVLTVSSNGNWAMPATCSRAGGSTSIARLQQRARTTSAAPADTRSAVGQRLVHDHSPDRRTGPSGREPSTAARPQARFDRQRHRRHGLARSGASASASTKRMASAEPTCGSRRMAAREASVSCMRRPHAAGRRKQ